MAERNRLRHASGDASDLIDRIGAARPDAAVFPTPFEIGQLGRRPGDLDIADPDRWWFGRKVLIGAGWHSPAVRPVPDRPAPAHRQQQRVEMLNALADWDRQWFVANAGVVAAWHDPAGNADYVNGAYAIMRSFRDPYPAESGPEATIVT